MPEVIIELAQGRTIEQKRALVRQVTQAVVDTCDVKPELGFAQNLPPAPKVGGLPQKSSSR